MAVPKELRGLVAPQAYKLGAVPAGIAVFALLMGWTTLAVIFLLLTAANLAFFRNPQRAAPAGEGRVLAPGDGKVVEVVALDDPGGFVGRAWRVAIFLSVLDVHVNRAPVSGKVVRVRQSGDLFLAAFNPSASKLNVQTRLDIQTAGGMSAAVVQITGLIARRIVCYAQEGSELVRGEPYGLICYGSRMEIYLPARPGVTIAVKVGDRVRAGESVLAEVA